MIWMLLLTIHVGGNDIVVKLDHFPTEDACEHAQAYFDEWILSDYSTRLSCEKLIRS